jgi:hypothetical protein
MATARTCCNPGRIDRCSSVTTPRDVNQHWNKEPAIWFRRWAGQALELFQLGLRPAHLRIQLLDTAH